MKQKTHDLHRPCAKTTLNTKNNFLFELQRYNFFLNTQVSSISLPSFFVNHVKKSGVYYIPYYYRHQKRAVLYGNRP